MNWHERIDLAEQSGGFTPIDLDLAKQWTTCACGEQDSRIPRNWDGAPLDFELTELGVDFYDAVCENNVSSARAVLAAIEVRAAELIKEST